MNIRAANKQSDVKGTVWRFSISIASSINHTKTTTSNELILKARVGLTIYVSSNHEYVAT